MFFTPVLIKHMKGSTCWLGNLILREQPRINFEIFVCIKVLESQITITFNGTLHCSNNFDPSVAHSS